MPVVLLLAALPLAGPTLLLTLLLLLPTLLSLAGDRLPGRPVTRVVLLFGVAAACPAVNTLWQGGQRLEDSLALGTDIARLAPCWAAQAGGWLLAQLLPVMIAATLNTEARRHIARLEQQRQRYETDFG